MKMPDVNVLVYAHRTDEEVHEIYRSWLEEAVNGPEPVALSVLAAAAFLRIVTNARIFTEPTPLPLALSAMEALADHPRCRLLLPGARHWSLVRDLCRSGGATGKLVADAQHAAMAIEHGCELVSRDRDFERFVPAGLRWTHLA